MPKESTPRLSELVAHFARLGTLGFGGPIALAGALQRDLVEHKEWISLHGIQRGVGAGAACSGPTRGPTRYLPWMGAFRNARRDAIAFAFVLPSLLMVLALAALTFASVGCWMQGMFLRSGRFGHRHHRTQRVEGTRAPWVRESFTGPLSQLRHS